jgi:hypothetical protein
MILKIKIQPNSKKNEILEKIEINGEEYQKIKINAPAVDNKANKELIKFLAKEFNVAKSNMKIIRGEKNSLKVLKIGQK